MSIASGAYPADQSWVLYYEFRPEKASGTGFKFNSTASGANHSFEVSKADTGTWLAGKYKGFAYVDNGTQRFYVWEGLLEVRPNYEAQNLSEDSRSHAQKCLDAINTVLEGKASKDVLNFTIAGQSVARFTFRELLDAKSYYEALVASERAAIDAANGKSTGQIKVRFTR